MKLVIDDNEISFKGRSDELYQDVAKLLVTLENNGDLPVRKALRIIALYSDLVKKDLL